MRTLNIAFLLVLSVLVWNCKKKEAPTDEKESESKIAFEEHHFSAKSPNCQNDSTRCAIVQATYPFAVLGDPAIINPINDTVMEYVRQTLAVFAESPQNIPESFDTIAAGFFKEYEDYLKEQSDYEISWEIETTGKVLYKSVKYISVQIDNYSYAGGAHPNTYVSLLNFDATNGKKIEIPNLIANMTRLTQLAEAKFREARQLEPNANLNEEGYFWDGAFALPANMALTEQGLYFFYNPYEAAAYALGPTDFTIPYNELKGVLKE